MVALDVGAESCGLQSLTRVFAADRRSVYSLAIASKWSTAMEICDILGELTENRGYFPREAVEEAPWKTRSGPAGTRGSRKGSGKARRST